MGGQSNIVPNFIALGQTMYEKRITFLPTCEFWRPRGPLGQGSIIEVMYSNVRSISVSNFVPF